jgi:hypothetical protein
MAGELPRISAYAVQSGVGPAPRRVAADTHGCTRSEPLVQASGWRWWHSVRFRSAGSIGAALGRILSRAVAFLRGVEHEFLRYLRLESSGRRRVAHAIAPYRRGFSNASPPCRRVHGRGMARPTPPARSRPDCRPGTRRPGRRAGANARRISSIGASVAGAGTSVMAARGVARQRLRQVRRSPCHGAPPMCTARRAPGAR